MRLASKAVEGASKGLEVVVQGGVVSRVCGNQKTLAGRHGGALPGLGTCVANPRGVMAKCQQ